jgi:hypothetical protein
MKLLVAVFTPMLDFVILGDGNEVVEKVELFEVLWLLTELVELVDCEELEDIVELEDNNEELSPSEYAAALLPPITELLE